MAVAFAATGSNKAIATSINYALTELASTMSGNACSEASVGDVLTAGSTDQLSGSAGPSQVAETPEETQEREAAESTVAEYASAFLGNWNIWGMGAGWTNIGAPEIDIWASALSSALSKNTPSELNGIPVQVFIDGAPTLTTETQ